MEQIYHKENIDLTNTEHFLLSITDATLYLSINIRFRNKLFPSEINVTGYRKPKKVGHDAASKQTRKPSVCLHILFAVLPRNLQFGGLTFLFKRGFVLRTTFVGHFNGTFNVNKHFYLGQR